MIIAWRVQLLMRLGRTCPERDCEVMFERDEWQAAYIVARMPIPEQPASLSTVVRLIASFGGFLGRKGDREPGVEISFTAIRFFSPFHTESESAI